MNTVPSHVMQGLPWQLGGEESTCNAGNAGLVSGSGRSPGEENGNPLQYSCLGNPMERGAWWATVLGLQESDTTLQLNHHHQSNANTSFGLFFQKFAYSLTLSMCWTLNTRLFDVYHHVGFPNYVLLFRILNLFYTHEQTAYLFY